MMSADNQQGRLLEKNKQLHPQYIVGFVDGEGSFHIAIYKDPRMNSGLKFIPEFHISQRISSKHVLESIRDYFDCGYVKANHAINQYDKTYVFVVRKREDLLEKIIPFFEKNPLKTEKQNDFLLFSQIVKSISEGKHRKVGEVAGLLSMAYQMNQAGKYRKKKYQVEPSETKCWIPILSGKI